MEKRVHSKKKQLKRQFENKLATSGNVRGYRPTALVAAHWFSKLNVMLFGSRLGRVHIEVKRLVGDWGRCVANWDNRKTPKGSFDQRKIPHHVPVDHYIQLHEKFPTWKDFIETLAHEMVHLYQMTVMKDPFSNHNKNFYTFRQRFESAGLRLYR